MDHFRVVHTFRMQYSSKQNCSMMHMIKWVAITIFALICGDLMRKLFGVTQRVKEQPEVLSLVLS